MNRDQRELLSVLMLGGSCGLAAAVSFILALVLLSWRAMVLGVVLILCASMCRAWSIFRIDQLTGRKRR